MKYEVGEWYESNKGKVLYIGQTVDGLQWFSEDNSTLWALGHEGITITRHIPRWEIEGWEVADTQYFRNWDRDVLVLDGMKYYRPRQPRRVAIRELKGTVEMRDGKPDFTTYKED